MPGLAPAAAIDFFGPRGLLARALPTYEERPAQARLAHAVGEVKRDVKRLCDQFPLYAARLEAYEAALAAHA